MHLETFLSEDLKSDVIDMMIRAQPCASNTCCRTSLAIMQSIRYCHHIRAAVWDMYAVHTCRSIRGTHHRFSDPSVSSPYLPRDSKEKQLQRYAACPEGK